MSLGQATREARAAQAMLEGATARFKAVTAEVLTVVGGSTQAIDKELTRTLQESVRDADKAIEALGAAAHAARAANQGQ
ncbi:hypothetical protein [Microlunatus flavus]|uniref:Uncharacterized protein n=1 Tax=Microlunatus flavus TaxID=1036181 RepID=A0A1H9D5Y9_9ACTN|nr:hypothetical protein [Microlunatus flavus]SEQ08273.1 hypothetical protein SAMN05421756_102432 [Microlunatus flavus]